MLSWWLSVRRAALPVVVALALALGSCLTSYEAPGPDSGVDGGEEEPEGVCAEGEPLGCNAPPWDAPWVGKVLGFCQEDGTCMCGAQSTQDPASGRCVPVEGVDMELGTPAYRWVRVCSLTEGGGPATSPGPDVDGVAVRSKASGELFWASELGAASVQDDGSNAFVDPSRALGEADATSLDPADRGCAKPERCAGVLSLGDKGHYVVLGFGQDVLPKDRMAVVEVGAEVDPGEGVELASVAVSYQASPKGYWVAVGVWDGSDSLKAPPFDPKLPSAPCP